MDPMASYIGLPVYDVNPIHPAATITPNTAAASSNNTTLILGSRLRSTEETKKGIVLTCYALKYLSVFTGCNERL